MGKPSPQVPNSVGKGDRIIMNPKSRDLLQEMFADQTEELEKSFHKKR